MSQDPPATQEQLDKMRAQEAEREASMKLLKKTGIRMGKIVNKNLAPQHNRHARRQLAKHSKQRVQARVKTERQAQQIAQKAAKKLSLQIDEAFLGENAAILHNKD